MNTDTGRLFFTAGIDNDRLRADAEQSKSILHGIGQTALQESAGIEASFGRIAKAAGSVFAISQIKEYASSIISLRGEIQSLEISFNTLLGSEEKGAAMFGEIRQFAVQTPMMLKDLAAGAQTMLAFNIEAEKVMPMLKAIGDISMGDAGKFNSLALSFSQMSATGKLMGQDLLQMINAGFNPLSVISEKTGKSIGDLKDEMEKGKITVEMVTDAFIAATSEGGKFHGMLEKQSQGLNGAISNLQGAVDDMYNSIGTSAEGVVVSMVSGATEVVKNWETVGMVLSGIAASYGVEKAIMAGASTVAASSYAAEMSALSALLPVKEDNIALDLKEAVAKGKITAATAEKVMAIRQEVSAHLESLAATEAAARAEAAAAAQKYRAALQQSLAAKAAVAAKREELVVSGQIVGSYISENAIKEMGIVTERAKAAAIQSTAAKQEYAAAMTQKKIAVDALETAQTNADTVAKNLNARSTGLLTVAKESLAKTTRKLYAAMMAHPYALLTAAVVALGYSIYKLATYQTEEQKMAMAVQKANDEVTKSYGTEVKKLDELNKSLKSAQKGSDEWKKAKQAIIDQYGQYNSNLSAEIDKVGDLTLSYKKLTSAIRESIAAKGLKDFHDKNDKSGERELDYSEWYNNNLKGVFSQTNVEDLVNELSAEYAKNPDTATNYFEHMKMALIDRYGLEKGGEFYDVIYPRLKKVKVGELNRMHKDAKRESQAEKDFMEANGISEETRNKVLYGIEPSSGKEETRNGDTIDAELKAKKEELAKHKKTSAEYKKLIEEINTLQKERAEWGDDSDVKTKKTTGPTPEQIAAKEENAAAKLADLLRKQAKERLRIEQDYEYDRWQTRIDLMAEGEAKVLAQQQLNNSKELRDLRDQKEKEEEAELQRQIALFDAKENEKAAGDKKYAKKTFRDSDIDQSEFDKIAQRYETLEKDLLAKQQKAQQERLDVAKESMNAYLKEFGDYQQKRVAIQEEYDKKIAEAANSGERMMLEAQKNKAVADLDYNEWISTGEIALAFGDISTLSEKTIDRLIEDMERYRQKVIDTFDPEKIQKYEEALTALRGAQTDNSFGFLSSVVPDYFKQRRSLSAQLESSASNVNALRERRTSLNMRRSSLEGAIKETKSRGGDASEMEKELESLNVELDNNAAAYDNAAAAFSRLQEQWDSMDSPEDKFYAICDAVNQAAGLVGGLANSASSMCEALGADGLGEAMDYVGEAMGSVQNIASGFANGGLVGGIAAAAGEVMNWVTKLAMAGDERHEKKIIKLQEQIDTLQKSYDKLAESTEDAFSVDASNLIQQQNQILVQQRALIQQQIAEEKAKKKSDSDRIKEYEEQLAEIDKAIGENGEKAKDALTGSDMRSAISDFAEAYAASWEDGTDAAAKSMAVVKSLVSSALTELLKKHVQPYATQFYDALAEAMEDGVLTDAELARLDALKAQLDAVAEKDEAMYDKIKERYKDLDELREELTDISFDSVSDNFKSLLTDMESSAEDFTDSFTDMLRNALVEGLMNEKYNALLKEWYEEFAEAMEDHTLTDDERERLRQQYQSIVDQGLEDRDAIKDIIGGDAYSQSATSGGWASMGQDTADELNGRFTALTELYAIGNEYRAEGNRLTAEILATLRTLGVTKTDTVENKPLLDIRDMMFLSTGYLEDIARYTKMLISIDERLTYLNQMIDRKL